MPADHNAIEVRLVGILDEMIQDWDLELDDSIGPETRLMTDLEFESIDVVQFAVSIEQAFAQKDLPFEKLFMSEGDYVEELTVSQVAKFLSENVSIAEAPRLVGTG